MDTNKKRQILGIRFLRQHIIDSFILDFYSPELKLGIEIDGKSHIDKEDYDRERNNIINRYGVQIVRYTNFDVLNDIYRVLADLKEHIALRK